MNDLKAKMAPRTKAAAPVKEAFQDATRSSDALKKTSINMRESLHTRVRVLAASQGITVGKVIEVALEKYLEERGM